ncbi:hypothetical protein ESZ50_05170 [Weissella muntiaci]|uniref:Uncharacterized protein n=1 Tax=Weissella muntiaci TaxID=2508881 RepID=A0A6C2C6H2_9LACO|nr:DUF6681 family protein [Weissella muntiaci]TYC49541.1 hypothetical protein ESZ50_05170 [Weissella muntiaci]
MLTILDLLNHYLGFFNVNTRWKGKVYTILAFFGNFYLLYLASKFLGNTAYLRASLLLLAFLVILYFSILNVIYYFTNKTVKWDISPKIEKYIGTQEVKEQRTNRGAFVPANGIYNKKDVLPATIVSDDDMQAEIERVAEQLVANGVVQTDFGGLTEQEQLAYLNTESAVYANHPGTPLPYSRLQAERGGMALYGGINEMFAKRLGRVMTVGLMPIAAALKENDLFIATAVIKGGQAHVRGRAGLTEAKLPYSLHVELAYKAKATSK